MIHTDRPSPLRAARQIFDEMTGKPRAEVITAIAEMLVRDFDSCPHLKGAERIYSAEMIANTYYHTIRGMIINRPKRPRG